LISHDQILAGSYYGKFFSRNLHLYLLQRRPEEWRNLQAESHKQKQQSQGTNVTTKKVPVAMSVSSEIGKPPPLQTAAAKRRHSEKPEDEIDAVFNAGLGKKPRTAALRADDKMDDTPEIPQAVTKPLKGERNPDKELQGVLGAIRLVPKDVKGSRKKRKRSS
jgi:nucleolar protein 9